MNIPFITVIFLLLNFSLIFAQKKVSDSTVTDIDGNVYKTITIGTQTWMAENLRVTHYRNGDPIPYIKGETDVNQWGNLTTGAYCYYNNTKDVDKIVTYGALYNWHAISDVRSIAPEGWHVPTDAEWTALTNYLDDGITHEFGSDIAGGMLKEAVTLHWGPANRASNSSGFTALPGGIRALPEFQWMGYDGTYWTSTEYNSLISLCRSMNTDGLSISRTSLPKTFGVSIRCMKD